MQGSDPQRETWKLGMRLLIVEDHELLAQSLGAALRDEGMDVHMASGPTAQDILDAFNEIEPELVLLDLNLGDGIGSGVPLIGPLSNGNSNVVMLTGSTDPVQLATAVEAGAVGVLNKSMSFDALLAAVREATQEGTLLTAHQRSELLDVLRRSRHERDRRLRPFQALTPREGQVLAGLMAGKAAETIANESFVSLATVRSQIRSILAKLDVNSQLAAVALARSAGWEPPPAT